MTTRSNLTSFIDAEDEDLRSLDEVLLRSTRAPSINPAHTDQSTLRSTYSATTIPTSIALQTPLEQKFDFLKDCSKEAFLVCYPSFISYQNQGGSRLLPHCMDPQVQNTFMFLLSQFEDEPIQTFLSTSSADLFLYIEQQFQLSIISNYRGFLSVLYVKKSDKFNRQACNVYIQHVTNLLKKIQ